MMMQKLKYDVKTAEIKKKEDKRLYCENGNLQIPNKCYR